MRLEPQLGRRAVLCLCSLNPAHASASGMELAIDRRRWRVDVRLATEYTEPPCLLTAVGAAARDELLRRNSCIRHHRPRFYEDVDFVDEHVNSR